MGLLSFLNTNFFGKKVGDKELRARIGLEKLLEVLDKSLENGVPNVIVFSAPTGYGKSLAMIGISEYLSRELPYGISKLIHVLPMRSMVEDLASRARKVVNALNLSIEVGAQCSSPLGSLKDPTFLRDYVITTLDSYTLNLFKATVFQYTPFAHYEMPRAHIYTALNVFDEAHLFVEEGRPFVALIASLTCLYEVSLPSLLLTATIPTHLVYVIRGTLSELGVSPDHMATIYVAKEDPHGNFPKKHLKGVSFVEDSDWLETSLSVRYETILEKSRKRVLDGILEEAPSQRKVLIVKNAPSKAVETFREVIRRGEKAILIHGRMRSIDRYAIVSNLNDFRGIVVATQVVEAGVDLDADLMATDMAPMPQLVQRLGRLCRDLDKHQGQKCRVWILYYEEEGKGERYGPYDAEFVELSYEALKKAIESYGVEGVLWRSPSFGKVSLGTGKGATTYLRVLEYWAEKVGLEAKLRFGDDDISMLNTLRGIDSLIKFRNDHAKALLKRFGSFVREYPMIPIILVPGIDRELSPSKSLQTIINELEESIEEEIERYRGMNVEIRGWDLASIASTYFSIQLDAQTLKRKLDEVCFERWGKCMAFILSEEGTLKLHLESASRIGRLLDKVVEGNAEEFLGYLDRLAQHYRATPVGILAPWDEKKLFIEGFEYPIGLV